ncbi:TPA: formyltransferase family protein [Vibrio vulnificus]|uniref:formyltransferase family protein n=1 Tax=Vibrio vulnificus TaxID=672 RepID=UPI001A2D93CE|nr:hypothetical protein [Vibrio vulnificus]HDY7654584.1 hypothetical protein [Vibrio vulnificus]
MKNNVRVAFLGSRPLGRYALELLNSYENVEIVAVVTKEKHKAAWWDQDPNDLKDEFPQVELDDLKSIDFDLGVSINYWKIIDDETVSKPRLGFINLHHSHNLYLRGRDMTSHAILNARASNIWHHGTCLHYTDDGLDTGPVIASLACDIDDKDTSWTLFNKVEEIGRELLKEWLPRVLKAKLPTCKPSVDNPIQLRNELSREIKIKNKSNLEVYDFVRAFDFNNYFEPAYYIDEFGDKNYLTINKDYGNKIFLNIDIDKNVYFNEIYKEI